VTLFGCQSALVSACISLKMAKLFALCFAALLCGTMAYPQFNYGHYPNFIPGLQSHIYNYRPQFTPTGCTYWCRSQFTSQYYCCSSPQEEYIAGNAGGFNRRNFNNYNPYNPYLG